MFFKRMFSSQTKNGKVEQWNGKIILYTVIMSRIVISII